MSVPTLTSATAGGATRRRVAVALLVAAQFVVMLDTSIVNVALPSIQRDLALGPAAVAWVVNAYVLSFGGLLLLAGRVADVMGRRRLFAAGAAAFTLGSLVAASAGSGELLVAGRVVQGAGAAALSPAAMSLLLLMFPGPARARAMSAWGAASTLGGATGVVAGGLLTGTLGWSWVFLVTVPLTGVAALAARRLLPGGGGTRPSRRFDTVGAVAATGAVLALVHAALSAPAHGWSSPTVMTGAGVAVLLGCVFVAVERTAPDPLVPLDLFRSRVLSVGVLLGVLGGAARASTFVLVALYLQQAVSLAPQVAGLAMLPTSLAGFVVSLALLPRVLRLVGPERSMVLGLVVLASGHLWLARTPAQAVYVLDVLPGLLLVAAGVALSFTPTTMVIASSLPADRSGLASGLAGSSTQVGAALGMAAFTAVAVSAGVTDGGVISGPGFSAAFAAAALVAVLPAATAAAGLLPRRPPGTHPTARRL